jgi:hypothetical protein
VLIHRGLEQSMSPILRYVKSLHWFLQEQREEVSSMSDLLQVVERGRDNLLLVEDHLARRGGGENALETGAPPAAGGTL